MHAICLKCLQKPSLLSLLQDIEYIRSHYNIEDFIYFSHHQREEHGHMHHFALNPIFRHYTKFFLKEILRLGFKSCLYYPVYPKSREGKVREWCDSLSQQVSVHSVVGVVCHILFIPLMMGFDDNMGLNFQWPYLVLPFSQTTVTFCRLRISDTITTNIIGSKICWLFYIDKTETENHAKML